MYTQEIYHPESFDPFAPDVLSALQGQQQRFDKYDFIYLNPASEQKLYFVREGLVRLGNYTEDGKELTYSLVGEGAILGSFSQQQQGRPFAQAFSDVALLALSAWEIKMLFQRDSRSAFEIFKLMGEQLHAMEKQFKMLAYCDVHQRIMHFILYLADLYGYRHQQVTFIPHTFTHEDISQVIHTSRQTVTVTLRELQKQGYLTYRRGEFRIYRYDELTALANECIQ
jgi:CRP-like cAMP-binding protein